MKLLNWVAAATSLLFAGFTPAAPDCREPILQAYRSISAASLSGQDKAMCLRFITETVSRPPGQSADRQLQTQGELHIQADRVYFHTKEMTLWQDGRTISAVLPKQRMVYLTRVPPHKTSALQPLQLLRDSLIQKATVLLCRQEVIQGHAQQHIRLALAPAVTAHQGVQTIEFYLEGKPAKIRQLTAYYKPGGVTQRVTLKLIAQQWLTSSPFLTANARQQVLDKQQKLLPAYQGYELLDQTTLSAGSR